MRACVPRRTGPVATAIAIVLSLCAAPAIAAPVSGPREVVDNTWTATKPNAPSGFAYSGRYHGEGDPESLPPYMRRMVFFTAPGARYDTSVPARCTASDLELAALGGAACPADSKLGGGTTEAAFMGDGSSRTTVDMELFNNRDEQILVARSPLLATIARGRIHPDGSIEFASPTCYPSISVAGCPVDNVLQLATVMSAEPFTRTAADGTTRSYLTTPPTCPRTGRWQTPITFWWADGAVDTVVSEQPCTRPRSLRRAQKPRSRRAQRPRSRRAQKPRPRRGARPTRSRRATR